MVLIQVYEGEHSLITASGCALSKCKSKSDILFRSNTRAQSLMETSPVALSPPCTAGSPLVSRSLVGLRRHAMLPTHAFYRKDLCSAPISAAAEPSIWMSSSEPGLGMDSSPINSISPSMPGLGYSPMPMESLEVRCLIKFLFGIAD